ncbi:MAG: hypothetical protein WD872_02405 [Pirellulaceae bacterium]
MTLHGHIRGGFVVLDVVPNLPEGTAVEVRVVETAPAASARQSVLLKYAGIVEDLPEDASASVDRVLYGAPTE